MQIIIEPHIIEKKCRSLRVRLEHLSPDAPSSSLPLFCHAPFNEVADSYLLLTLHDSSTVGSCLVDLCSICQSLDMTYKCDNEIIL
jgi:hypothetical protein